MFTACLVLKQLYQAWLLRSDVFTTRLDVHVSMHVSIQCMVYSPWHEDLLPLHNKERVLLDCSTTVLSNTCSHTYLAVRQAENTTELSHYMSCHTPRP